MCARTVPGTNLKSLTLKAFREIAAIQEIPTLDCREADPEYLAFRRRCQWLRDDVRRKFGVPLNPRQLDNLLLRQWAGETAR
jgi:hypothetical protein